MQPTYEFCEARAQEAAVQAAAATLTNRREQALRAEAAWRAMADKQRAVVDARNAKLREQKESCPAV